MNGVSVLGNIKALARGQVYEFPVAAVTNYHTRMASDNTHLVLAARSQQRVSLG